MKKSLLQRIGGHARDSLIKRFPLALHSASGNAIDVSNRSQIRLYEQIFVENVFNLAGVVPRVDKPAPIIIDLGANCGFFTLKCLDFWPQAIIHAFEPQADLVDSLERSLTTNGHADHVYANCAAVGAEKGSATLFQNRSPISASLIKEKAGRRRIIRQTEVAVTSLDGYLDAQGITSLDILKIDVEGSELDVVAGGRKALSMADVVFMEVHPPFATADQMDEVLAEFGLVRERSLEKTADQEQDLVFVRPAS